MSTISDALKKRRDEEAEPSTETRGPRVVEVHVPKDHSARNILLVTVLAVVLLTGAVVGGYALLGKMGAFDRRPAPPPVGPPRGADVPAVSETPSLGPTEPTTERGPAEEETDPLAGLKLQGIFADPLDPRAVINDRRLKIGGTVKGFKLVAVEADRVVLERGGKRYELVLE